MSLDGWLGSSTTEIGKLLTVSVLGCFTMNNLILFLSMIFRLNASRESNGAKVSAFVRLKDNMNFLIAAGVIPRRFRASSVGNLGSSYHEIFPSSIKGLKILFDTGFRENTVIENAASLNIDLSMVEHVLLSHNHSDHT